MKFKKGDCVLVDYFGPLYINDSFKDDSGKVWCGINGIDGVSYQFNANQVIRKLSREEFDLLPKCVEQPKGA